MTIICIANKKITVDLPVLLFDGQFLVSLQRKHKYNIIIMFKYEHKCFRRIEIFYLVRVYWTVEIHDYFFWIILLTYQNILTSIRILIKLKYLITINDSGKTMPEFSRPISQGRARSNINKDWKVLRSLLSISLFYLTQWDKAVLV